MWGGKKIYYCFEGAKKVAWSLFKGGSTNVQAPNWWYRTVKSISFRISNYLFDGERTGQESNKKGHEVCHKLKTRFFFWLKLKVEARRPRLDLEHNTCSSCGLFLFILTFHRVGDDAWPGFVVWVFSAVTTTCSVSISNFIKEFPCSRSLRDCAQVGGDARWLKWSSFETITFCRNPPVLRVWYKKMFWSQHSSQSPIIAWTMTNILHGQAKD